MSTFINFIDEIDATLSMNIAKYQSFHCGDYPEKIFMSNSMLRYMSYLLDFKWSVSYPWYSYKNIPVTFYENENGRPEFYLTDCGGEINL